GIPATADPLGGSYYIETLTDQIEAGARDYLARIAELGGTLAALESGFLQREIQEIAYRTQQDLETGRLVKVSVNRFTEESENTIPLMAFDPAAEAAQRERVQQIRAKRDNAAVAQQLAA